MGLVSRHANAGFPKDRKEEAIKYALKRKTLGTDLLRKGQDGGTVVRNGKEFRVTVLPDQEKPKPRK